MKKLFSRDKTLERIETLKERCKKEIDNGNFQRALHTLSQLNCLAERHHVLEKAEMDDIDFSDSKQETLE